MRFLLLVSSALLFPLALPAQEEGSPPPGPPGPAPEMKKLEPMLGHFEGEGFFVGEAGGPRMPWKAVSVVRKVLGGHWQVEDTVIEFEARGLPKLYFHTYTGWDRERKRYVIYMTGNTGRADRMDLEILGDGRILTSSSMIEEGKRVLEWNLSEYDDKGFRFVDKRSVDGADPFVSIQGRFLRVGKVEAEFVDAAFPTPKPVPELAALRGIAGKYRLKGAVIPMPGMEEMPISGVQTVRSVFSGRVLFFESIGDPMQGFRYRDFATLAWDPEIRSFRLFFVNNVGEHGFFRSRFDPKTRTLVSFSSGPMMGRLAAHRSEMRLAEDGSILSSSDVLLLGNLDPYTAFKAAYERLER